MLRHEYDANLGQNGLIHTTVLGGQVYLFLQILKQRRLIVLERSR